MISQFKSIIRVGKFSGFNAVSGTQYEFKKKTIVFGRNTLGKSTLTAVAKSLAEGEPDYILGRKTFGENTDQKVVVKESFSTGNSTHVFESDAWTSSMQHIRVFDTKYVRKNVHTEEAVANDQQLKLEALILGSQGESLRRNLDDTDRACKDNSDKKAALTNEYNRYLKPQTGIDFQEFIKINPDNDLQAKIDSQKDRIATYRKYDEIQKAIASIDQTIDKWNFIDMSHMLQPNLEISQQIIRDHIEHNLLEKQTAQEFLHAGFGQIKQEGACPFCSQDISSDSAKELISELSTLFSDSYRKLRQDIKNAEDKIKDFNPRRDIESRIGRLNDLGEEIDLNPYIDKIIEAKKHVAEEIQVKKDDYSHTFNAVVVYNLAEAIKGLYDALDGMRTKYASDFDESHLQKLQSEYKKLEVIKERSSQRWIDNCGDYEKIASKTKELSNARATALNNKNEYAKGVFAKYSEQINRVLSSLNAQFELVNLQPRSTVRSKQPLYALKFNGTHQVAITPVSENEAGFDNTLSESDKRLLGFAFFLAEISLDSNKNELIIFLDDPMSSFDTERKQATAKLLNSLTEEVEQVVVLTHEEGFLKILHRCFEDSALFKIVPSAGSSSIESMDINDEYLDKYYKDIAFLEKIAIGEIEASYEDLRCMRDITEEIMTRKYYIALKDDHANGGSIGSFVSTLKEQGIYTDTLIQELKGLNLHSWNHNDSLELVAREDFSTGDLQTFARNFLEVLRKL